MKHLSFMIKPASSLCNLRCRYCFYADVSARRSVPSHGIMTQATTKALVENIWATLEDGTTLSIAFQGGEPTLAGLDYFQNFVALVAAQHKKTQVSYSLQTNGILLDEDWCRFLRKHRFLVGLSLDGYAENHNQNRLDEKGQGSFAKVMAAKRLLDKTQVEYNLLCTLTNGLARHPQKVWKFLLEEKIGFAQFTPCLAALGGQKDEWALTPRRFHSFYAALFPLWRQALQRGTYISVKLFDDIVNLFVRQQITACGLHGQCQIQNAVEADGGVYPCDFYVLDEYNGGNLTQSPLPAIQAKLEQTGFLHSRPGPPAPCSACRYNKVCQGGCKRMQTAMYLDETGFCGYRQLLDDIGDELCHIGARLLAQREGFGHR